MVKKIFYSIQEAFEATGSDQQLFLELIEFHGLRFYCRLAHRRAENHWEYGLVDDTLRAGGEHDLARWRFHRRDVDPLHPDVDPSYYTLSGYHELSDISTLTIAMGRVEDNPRVSSYRNGQRFGEFFEIDFMVTPELTVVRVADIEALLATDSEAETNPVAPMNDNGKPLDERERGSLLRTIRALGVMANLPNRGAASSIELQLQEMGFAKPSEATIRKIIEQARALEPDENRNSG